MLMPRTPARTSHTVIVREFRRLNQELDGTLGIAGSKYLRNAETAAVKRNNAVLRSLRLYRSGYAYLCRLGTILVDSRHAVQGITRSLVVIIVTLRSLGNLVLVVVDIVLDNSMAAQVRSHPGETTVIY